MTRPRRVAVIVNGGQPAGRAAVAALRARTTRRELRRTASHGEARLAVHPELFVV